MKPIKVTVNDMAEGRIVHTIEAEVENQNDSAALAHCIETIFNLDKPVRIDACESSVQNCSDETISNAIDRAGIEQENIKQVEDFYFKQEFERLQIDYDRLIEQYNKTVVKRDGLKQEWENVLAMNHRQEVDIHNLTNSKTNLIVENNNLKRELKSLQQKLENERFEWLLKYKDDLKIRSSVKSVVGVPANARDGYNDQMLQILHVYPYEDGIRIVVQLPK